jgi:hypothetical protein
MKLKYFDEINPNELEDYYSTDIELDEHAIQLDLNFSDISIDESRLSQSWDFYLKYPIL